MGIDLPLIWAVIIIFGIMMYVVMDGFDLGIGMLYPFFKDSGDRDVMMNTVAPVWDGNETWLVLGGAALFGAFPLAYAVVLSALYLPLIFMLVGLIFRGVAFEFRFKAKPAKQHIWDKAFIGGSLVATFFQGVALGAFIEGIPVENRSFAGGSLDWIAPFPLFCGLALIVAYTLLGCTWLIMKTEGRLQERMHDLARPLALVLLAIIGVVSLWTPLAHADLLCAAALGGQQRPHEAVRAHPGVDLPRLQRPGDQPVAEHHPAGGEHLGGLGAAAEPGLHAGRRAVHHSLHPRLHRLQLLRISRQERRCRLSLSRAAQEQARPIRGVRRAPARSRANSS